MAIGLVPSLGVREVVLRELVCNSLVEICPLIWVNGPSLLTGTFWTKVSAAPDMDAEVRGCSHSHSMTYTRGSTFAGLRASPSFGAQQVRSLLHMQLEFG